MQLTRIPRILIPRRPRIRWCPVHRRVVNMAAGDRLLGSGGEQILDASGNVQLSDGAGDSCCCCSDYYQAKSCFDDSDADLWLLCPTMPYYFSKDGSCYYIKSTNNHDPTPGTLLTGQTVLTGCNESPCDCSNCSDSPSARYTVTISGVTITTGTCVSSRAIRVGATIAGTFCVTRSTVSGGTCQWYVVDTSTNVITDQYGNAICSGLPVATYNGFTVSVEKTASTTMRVLVFVNGGIALFDGTATTGTDCNSDFTVSTNVATVGTGGTAVVTVGC